MKVVQVPRRFTKEHWGGTETVVLNTCQRLAEYGWETEIVCSSAFSKVGQENIDGIRVNRFSYFYPYWGLSSQAKSQMDQKGGNLFSFSIWRYLKNMPELDLLHLHTGKRLAGIGRMVAKSRKIPYLVSLHGGALDVPKKEADELQEPGKGALEWGKALGWLVGSRKVFADASAIICLGPEEQKRIQQVYPRKKVVVLPNGVEPEAFTKGEGQNFKDSLGLDHNTRIILTIARLDPQKEQLTEIKALSKILAGDPDLCLVLIGPVTDEIYYQRIKSKIQDLGLNSKIRIIKGLKPGSRELINAYKAADLFLLCSRHEPFGIAVLEAWAAGLPVAVSKVGGLASLVNHNKDGLFFEPGDFLGIQKATQRLLTNPNLSRNLGEAGQKRAIQEFSWARITEKLAILYGELLR